MAEPSSLFIGRGTKDQFLDLSLANRHGLIAGATGTGKTVSLQILTEAFSAQGVPVFLADVKGDLAGLAMPGTQKKGLANRARDIGLDPYEFRDFPVVFWDLFGEKGHPLRSTITEMGPVLLSRQLDLNETQEGVLTIAFKMADDEGLLLTDLKDLRALLAHMDESKQEISRRYGRVTAASIGAIQRRLLTLETQGGDQFFGEPALKIADLMQRDAAGQGHVNILAADKLMAAPQLYATFLLWLLSELFEDLDEVGDAPAPRLVFFFDEAHLLFDTAPKHLVDRIEQTVKLIRSKGVGIFFVTQNPMDIPDEVLGQLGHRIQHALRAYTPRDAKAVRIAAQTFRPNPDLDTEQVITELGIGEALVSTLDAKGVPTPVERTLIRPPSSRLGPISAAERRAVLQASRIGPAYDTAVDRESAFEIFQRRMKADAAAEERERETPKAASRKAPRSRRQGYGETLTKSALRQIGRTLGRALVRGIMGSLSKRT